MRAGRGLSGPGGAPSAARQRPRRFFAPVRLPDSNRAASGRLGARIGSLSGIRPGFAPTLLVAAVDRLGSRAPRFAVFFVMAAEHSTAAPFRRGEDRRIAGLEVSCARAGGALEGPGYALFLPATTAICSARAGSCAATFVGAGRRASGKGRKELEP